jgi:hypothetical protein
MDKRILEGIEACRPLSDDLHSSEMSEVERQVRNDPAARLVYERVQKWDAAISASMEDVPLPPGLAERLRERLEASVAERRSPPPAAALSRVVAAAMQAAAVPPHQANDVRPGRRGLSRRQWVGVGVSTLAAALLVAGGLIIFQPRDDISLEAMAEDWLHEIDAHPDAWRSMQPPPRSFAIPSVVSAAPDGWRPIDKYATGVAFKLVHEAAGSAILYVARLSRPNLPSAPPSRPQFTSGGKAIGYWQSGGVIYVLVVPGDERSYRTFVRSAPIPLA